MAKHDWKALQAEFLRDNAATGITAQQWCENRGLNYQSARRYIKPRAAQSAQNKQRNNAHSAQRNENAQNCAGGNDSVDDDEHVSADANEETDTAPDPDAKPNSGRDGGGRFTAGNKNAAGNRGNSSPVTMYSQHNQAARKHSAYAKYLDADELFDAVANSDLHDELIFTRARALSVTKTMKQIMEDLQKAESVETRIELYDKFLKAEQGLDRNIGRIESIERTLSNLQLNAVNVPRLSEDTLRIKAATAKLKAETQKLTAESKDVTTPLSGIVSDIQGMTDNGLMTK
ncbi:terminase [Serratia proteamaculans]|uniref:terminase n=1 Tax=Serratia proteamaculans TaxID=28151 RepID=UPI0039BEA3CB